MTIDKAQLKALAEAADVEIQANLEMAKKGIGYASFVEIPKLQQFLRPSIVLDLLAEIVELQGHKQFLIDLRETHGFDSWSAALVEIDRLKVVNEHLRHERDTLGQAIGEAVVKGGIAAPGFSLTGPQLLMFLEDLANDSVRMSTENEELKAKHAECAEFIDQASLDAPDHEALRKDAERYRFLRDPDEQDDPDSDYNMPPIICGYAEHEEILAKGTLDRAIDAAMAQDDAGTRKEGGHGDQ